jgi:MFS family permease
MKLSARVPSFVALNNNIKLYLVSYFFIHFSFSGIYMVLFNLYLLRLEFGPEFIGVVNGAIFVSFAVSAFPIGIVSRRHTIRSVLLFGAGLAICGWLITVNAGLLKPGMREISFVIGAVISGVGFAANVVTSFPLLMTCAEGQRTTAFSFRLIVELVGGFLGSLVGGFLPSMAGSIFAIPEDSAGSFRLALYGSLVVLVMALIPLSRIERIKLGAEQKGQDTVHLQKNAVPWCIVFVIVVITLLNATGMNATRTFFNVFLNHRFQLSPKYIGTLIAAARLLCIPGALCAPFLIGKTGRLNMIRIGLMASSAGILLLTVSSHWVLAAAGYIFIVVLGSISGPATESFNQILVKPEHRSLMSGAYSAAFGFGGSAMVISGGFIIGAFGFSRLFFISACFKLAAFAIFWAYFRRPRGEMVKVAAS